MNREEMLEEAKEVVCVDRQVDYGDLNDNFWMIADLWSVYLRGKQIISDYDVANMMILLKIARNRTGTVKADNWVDIAGYAACGCELITNGD